MSDSTPQLVAYLRDSGGDSQDLSVSQQEAALKAWAVQNGAVITRWFRDEARPGSSVVGRENFQGMINYLRRGAPEAGVVIWKMSRFARDIDDSQFYKADLRRRGYRVISINDNIPEGPEGRFFEAAIDWMNQRFLDDLSSDVKRGLGDLVRTYGAVPGTPPRGFKRQPVELPPRRDGSPHTVHRWVPDPEWLPRIRQAWELRAVGKSLAQINAETKIFGSINSYKTFFTNKLYIGVLEFGNLVIENYCEPIIDRDTWDAVQRIIQRYAVHRNMQSGQLFHPRRSYLLSGLAYCARCGSPLFGSTSNRVNGDPAVRRYACTRGARCRDCDMRPVPGPLLENLVLNTLREIILNPAYLAMRQAEDQADQAAQLAELGQQIAQENLRFSGIRRRIANVTNAIAETGVTRSLGEKLQQLEAEEADALTRLAALHDQQTITPEYSDVQLTRAAEALRQRLESEDAAVVRECLLGLVDKIVVDRDEGTLIGMITYFLPPVGNDDPGDDGHDPPDGGGHWPHKTASKSLAPLGAHPFVHTHFGSPSALNCGPNAGKAERERNGFRYAEPVSL